MEGVDSEDCDLYTNTTTCGGDGAYNRTLSTSAKLLEENFSYDDSGSQVTGEFVTDVLTIGSAKVNGMKMGVAESGLTISKSKTIHTSFMCVLTDTFRL